eukprot:CAMPEP_0194064832 /NCGR_PEP_ID=MMETSP0009_2-20130614/84069_1 /TAXON_ID=210454 /ORGANISM="Grammatophora oceanica, Strain CCMP 410" /LENGTH=63 /DNA_ID=CAMNT_0038717467 /DNA_START=57 /DNA_END=245 /DNA_ORIENTATION=+
MVTEAASTPVVPLGGSYFRSLRLPFFGETTFTIQIVSDRELHLKIHGRLLKIDDLVPYEENLE